VLGGILLSLSPIAIDVEIDMMFDSKVGVAVTKDREMELLFNKLNLVSPQNCFQLKRPQIDERISVVRYLL